jgi:peptidoglycan/LPS O-acetylase OafA/YrhL
VTLPLLLITVLFVGSSTLANFFPLDGKEVYLLIFPGLYLLILWIRSSRLDNAIGQRAYPIFVIHWVVILFVERFFDTNEVLTGYIIIVISVALAWLIRAVVENPVDKFRHRRFRS